MSGHGWCSVAEEVRVGRENILWVALERLHLLQICGQDMRHAWSLYDLKRWYQIYRHRHLCLVALCCSRRSDVGVVVDFEGAEVEGRGDRKAEVSDVRSDDATRENESDDEGSVALAKAADDGDSRLCTCSVSKVRSAHQFGGCTWALVEVFADSCLVACD